MLGCKRGVESREKGMVSSSEIDAILTTVRMLIIGCIAWEIDPNNKIETMRTIQQTIMKVRNTIE